MGHSQYGMSNPADVKMYETIKRLPWPYGICGKRDGNELVGEYFEPNWFAQGLMENGRLWKCVILNAYFHTHSWLKNWPFIRPITFFLHLLPSKTYLRRLEPVATRSLSPHLGAFIFFTVSLSNRPVTFKPANFWNTFRLWDISWAACASPPFDSWI